MHKDNTRTFIYMSTSCWKDRELEALSMPEQTAICRSFMKQHSELKKIKTFHDRAAEKEPSKELYHLLEEIEHRQADCVVVASVRHFFAYSSEARYYLTRVMIPAGIRLIAISEKYDSREYYDEKTIRKLFWRK